MSEDPLNAIDEVVCRIDEAVGLSNGSCGGWLKRAPMDEVVNWLVNNIKERLLNARRLVSEAGDTDTLDDFYVIDMGDGEKNATRSRLRVFHGDVSRHTPLTRRDLYRGRMGEAECEYAHAFMCGGFPKVSDPERPSRDEWLDQKPYGFEVDKFVTDMLFGEGVGAILRREIDRLMNENEKLRKGQPVKRNCDQFNSGDPMKDAEDAYLAWERYCDNPTIPPSCKVESAFKYWIFNQKAERKGED